ncbi:MAG TPA: glycosyltransferase family 4 protein [bacterium]|nr:glycosyltransferase family 4 protein [bacterium]
MTESSGKKILHFTYDYPTEFSPEKTAAISNLINSASNNIFHFVINLNRSNFFGEEKICYQPSKKLAVINAFGLPKGLFFKYTIRRAIKNIEKFRNENNIGFGDYNLIHSHKLCFEGPVAYHYSKLFSIPLIVSIRTFDFPVLKYRFDLRNMFEKILVVSKKVLIISPWMENSLRQVFGEKFFNEILKHKIECIGSIIPSAGQNAFIANDEIENRIRLNSDVFKFVIIMKISELYIKVKNIRRIFKALNKLSFKFKFDIIGGGDSGSIIKLKKVIEKYKLSDRVNLIGYIENEKIINKLKEYDAFIMPSYPETFGMSYIEALYAGLPIMYSHKAGVSGFFDDSIGITVNPFDVNSILKGLNKIKNKNIEMKKNVYDFVKRGGLERFSSEKVGEKYLNILNSTVK